MKKIPDEQDKLWITLNENNSIKKVYYYGCPENGIEIPYQEFPYGLICYKYINGKVVLDEYIKEQEEQKQKLNELRQKRENECFNIYNRRRPNKGINKLTEEQEEKLDDWYYEWLNVTNTLKIPKKPDFI